MFEFFDLTLARHLYSADVIESHLFYIESYFSLIVIIKHTFSFEWK